MEKEYFQQVCEFVRWTMYAKFDLLTPHEWCNLDDAAKYDYVQKVFDFHADVCEYITAQLSASRLNAKYAAMPGRHSKEEDEE